MHLTSRPQSTFVDYEVNCDPIFLIYTMLRTTIEIAFILVEELLNLSCIDWVMMTLFNFRSWFQSICPLLHISRSIMFRYFFISISLKIYWNKASFGSNLTQIVVVLIEMGDVRNVFWWFYCGWGLWMSIGCKEKNNNFDPRWEDQPRNPYIWHSSYQNYCSDKMWWHSKIIW